MARPGDHVLVMSNGGFEDIHQRLLDALARDGSSASTAPSIAER
jgi:UDP-N-acetylmuramate: L-alanyl-gamma-D-glutamyl-meso-diaminopimelate ligase